MFTPAPQYLAAECGFSYDAPAIAGDCVVSLVKTGKRLVGNARHAAPSGNRLFLFANEDRKKLFTSNSQTYAKTDLAYDGNRVAWKRNRKQTIPGRPEIEVVYHGVRYRFASADQQKGFLSNPQEYWFAATNASTLHRGSNSGQPIGSGSR